MSTGSPLIAPAGWTISHTGCGEAMLHRTANGMRASIEESRSIMGGFRCIVERDCDGARLVDRHEQFDTLGAAVEAAETAMGVSA